MIYQKIINRFVLTTFLAVYAVVSFAQIGIKTENPTAMLDINGDLRVREVTPSTSTKDLHLVIDENGLVKTSLIGATLLRGYIDQDFIAGTDVAIYKVNNFKVIDGDLSQIDAVNGIFTPKVTGLYSIESTLTLTPTQDLSGIKNIVCGVVDNATGKWIMRYSIPKQIIAYMGVNSIAGIAFSFTGNVKLIKDMQYSFGITEKVKIIAKPTGTSGDGMGTYLSVTIIKSME